MRVFFFFFFKLCGAKWSRRHWRNAIITLRNTRNVLLGERYPLFGSVENRLKSWTIVFTNSKSLFLDWIFSCLVILDLSWRSRKRLPFYWNDNGLFAEMISCRNDYTHTNEIMICLWLDICFSIGDLQLGICLKLRNFCVFLLVLGIYWIFFFFFFKWLELVLDKIGHNKI